MINSSLYGDLSGIETSTLKRMYFAYLHFHSDKEECEFAVSRIESELLSRRAIEVEEDQAFIRDLDSF